MNESLPVQMHNLAELDLGSARGGKAGANKIPLTVELVRPLTQDDLSAIANPPVVGSQVQTVKSIRHSHHRLAQLIAEGKPQAEISLITGYSQTWISNIQGDPAFDELVHYYAEQRRTVFVDAQERLRVLGIDATEKLHEQLHDPGQVWSKRELMELVDLALAEPAKQAAAVKMGQGVAGPSLSLEVKFVGAQTAPGPQIEASFTEVKTD